MVAAVRKILSGTYDHFSGDGWGHQNVAALLPLSQRNWGATFCECACVARLDISKCDQRYPLHACGHRQVRGLSCPRRAWLVFAGKMVAAAGVYPSASDGPYQRRRTSRIDRRWPEASYP